MTRSYPLLLIFVLILFTSVATAQQPLDKLVASEMPRLIETYKHLHANPELSFFEEKTAAFVANQLREMGYEVTERVGKYNASELISYGVVGVMRNGKGPTVLIRTDLDALPLEEKTGLPYASTVRAKNDMGEESGVMHACGHDLHMTSFWGAAKMLTLLKDRWRGTIVLIGQPAEERGTGALAMLADGLYQRFPKPDYAIALHTDASLEAGKVAFVEGYALANVSSVDLIIRGVGGHGAYPQGTKDPIVLAAQIVLQLQTIVSRELSPFDPAVVTVGAIHGGTKHNIIPDEVHLQLTVRSYRKEVHHQILDAIERISIGAAVAAGIPADRMPIVNLNKDEITPATYNDPALTRRLAAALRPVLGEKNVVQKEPVMGAEDFGHFGLEGHQIPISMFWLGSVDPEMMKEYREKVKLLPGLHSSYFAPLPEPSIMTGVKALTGAALELMKK